MAEDGIKAEAEAHPALTAVGSGNRSSFPCCTHPQCSAAAPSIKVGRGSAHGEGASVCWGMSERVNGWTGWMVAQWPGLAQACEWIGVGEAKVPFVQAREHQRRNRTCPMELHARLVDGLMVGTASLSGCHRHRAAMRLARRLGHHHQHRVRCARTGGAVSGAVPEVLLFCCCGAGAGVGAGAAGAGAGAGAGAVALQTRSRRPHCSQQPSQSAHIVATPASCALRLPPWPGLPCAQLASAFVRVCVCCAAGQLGVGCWQQRKKGLVKHRPPRWR